MTERLLSVGEFVDRGILQEINRVYLHPRGLALQVHMPPEADSDRQIAREDVSGWFNVVETDDPEGYVFEGETALTVSDAQRARLLTERRTPQPLPDIP